MASAEPVSPAVTRNGDEESTALSDHNTKEVRSVEPISPAVSEPHTPGEQAQMQKMTLGEPPGSDAHKVPKTTKFRKDAMEEHGSEPISEPSPQSADQLDHAVKILQLAQLDPAFDKPERTDAAEAVPWAEDPDDAWGEEARAVCPGPLGAFKRPSRLPQSIEFR
jgi:hypothetical protein